MKNADIVVGALAGALLAAVVLLWPAAKLARRGVEWVTR